MARPRRPIRSVWLGNQRYVSAYRLGVGQAMSILGHWHRDVSIHDPADSVAKQIAEMDPDVVWTHMALWPPEGALRAETIAEIVSKWHRRGRAVYLHDGDPRARRVAVDVGSAFGIALVNRSVAGEGYWGGITCIRWPYAAMVQRAVGEPRQEWACDLLFAGHLRNDSLYGERTRLVSELRRRLGDRMRVVVPGDGGANNRMLAADIAPSVGAVLGLSRPDVLGWVDTRVFQYPGAGGLLLHDDAGEFLTPGEHYARFDRGGGADAVLEAAARAAPNAAAIRERAFQHVQANHTWLNRVEVALAAYYGAA